MDQQTPQAIPTEIRSFLESLLAEGLVVDQDAETKEAMIQELFYQLDNYLTSVIVDNLKDEDLETFIKMNEEKKPKEEIEGFITEKIPNAENLFTDAFIKFKDLYLENANKDVEKITDDIAQPQDEQPQEKPF